MTAAEYGRRLTGLSLNLIVRDVTVSVSFYRDVLGFKALYSDVDFAALARDSQQIQLHADHAYDGMPWWDELRSGLRRGLGAEMRIMGINPDAAERAARERHYRVLAATSDTAHGWRECILEDADGYTFAVGVAT